jgi:hypothetical protein
VPTYTLLQLFEPTGLFGLEISHHPLQVVFLVHELGQFGHSEIGSLLLLLLKEVLSRQPTAFPLTAYLIMLGDFEVSILQHGPGQGTERLVGFV